MRRLARDGRSLAGVSTGMMGGAVFMVLVVALGGCAGVDRPTRAAVLGGYDPHGSAAAPTQLELPPVPRGCVLRAYQIEPKRWTDAPRHQTDWTEYLRSLGMIFPRGGFAAYYPATGTLIVANTPKQLLLLDPF